MPMRGVCSARAEGDFVAAAERDGQQPLLQQGGKRLRELLLRCFETVVLAPHVAGVDEGAAAAHRQVGQHASQRERAFAGPHAALVARHAGVAGEPQQRHAARLLPERLHHLVPTPAELALFGIDPAAPAAHQRLDTHRTHFTMGSFRPCFFAVATASS